MCFRNRYNSTGSLRLSGNRKGTNSESVDEDGKVLCAVCKRKFFIGDVEACSYCGKWVCRMHRRRSSAVEGFVCDFCRQTGAK